MGRLADLLARIRNRNPVLFEPDELSTLSEGEQDMKHVQANSFKPAARGKGDIDRIVVHTAEIEEGADSAEAIAAFFAKPTTDVSAHKVVDTDTVVRCVLNKDIAFHALGDNDATIGYELAAKAGQSKAQWADPKSTKMLELAAEAMAEDAVEHDIPARWLTKEQEKDRKKGFVTHAVVSEVFGEGQRSDPGKDFPYKRFMEMVEGHMADEDKVKYRLLSGEGQLLTESLPVKDEVQARRERLRAFLDNSVAAVDKETNDDRDAVIRRVKAT